MIERIANARSCARACAKLREHVSENKLSSCMHLFRARPATKHIASFYVGQSCSRSNSYYTITCNGRWYRLQSRPGHMQMHIHLHLHLHVYVCRARELACTETVTVTVMNKPIQATAPA